MQPPDAGKIWPEGCQHNTWRERRKKWRASGRELTCGRRRQHVRSCVRRSMCRRAVRGVDKVLGDSFFKSCNYSYHFHFEFSMKSIPRLISFSDRFIGTNFRYLLERGISFLEKSSLFYTYNKRVLLQCVSST
jgi:hypothetical protein